MVLGATPAFAATNTPFAFSSLTPAIINAANPLSDLIAAGTGPDGATITVTLDTWTGGAIVVSGVWSVTIPAANVPEGLNVSVTASSSKEGSDTKTYTKDVTPPELTQSGSSTSAGKKGTFKGTMGTATTPTPDGNRASMELWASKVPEGRSVTFGIVTGNGNAWSSEWTASGGDAKISGAILHAKQCDGAQNCTEVTWTVS